MYIYLSILRFTTMFILLQIMKEKSYYKIISILWTIIGILLITLFLINAFRNLPLLFVYILLSPIIAILTYCG